MPCSPPKSHLAKAVAWATDRQPGMNMQHKTNNRPDAPLGGGLALLLERALRGASSEGALGSRPLCSKGTAGHEKENNYADQRQIHRCDFRLAGCPGAELGGARSESFFPRQ